MGKKNNRVKGRVVNSEGTPQAGLTVEAWDIDTFKDDNLGSAVTDSNGQFIIEGYEGKYGDSRFFSEKEPDIQLKIYRNGGLIFVTEEREDVKEETLDLGVIRLTANTGVIGRLVDNNDSPLVGFIVKACDADTPPFHEHLGQSLTGSDGEFEIRYSITEYKDTWPWPWGNESQPDIRLEIYTDNEEFLYAYPHTWNDINQEILDVGVLEVKGNLGVKGRVVDEENMPIANLRVIVYDLDISLGGHDFDNFRGCDDLGRVDVLGQTFTDQNGRYYISYLPSAYKEGIDKAKEAITGELCLRSGTSGDEPDIVVEVLDRLGVRSLWRSKEYEDVKEVILNIPDIEISRQEAIGWAATLGNSHPSRFNTHNTSEYLVDNQTFKRIIEEIEKAQSTIHILQLEFDPDFAATFHDVEQFSESMESIYQFTPSVILVEALLKANRRGIKVRILLNQRTSLIADSYDDIKDYFEKAGNNNVIVRDFHSTFRQMHAKTVIVDNYKAFVIGSPFIKSYWDTPMHFLNDERRGENERPKHDVSIFLYGETAVEVEENFRQLWNYVSDDQFDGKDKIDSIPFFQSNLLADHSHGVQIVRSIPKDLLSDIPEGERGILEVYLRAIGNAQDYIYIENQYFTNPIIACALSRALNLNEKLQVIILINEELDFPAPRSVQDWCLREIIGLPHPRVGVFTLWSIEKLPNRYNSYNGYERQINMCYTHSKVCIVDDKWATVGSANLDGISLDIPTDLLQKLKNYSLGGVIAAIGTSLTQAGGMLLGIGSAGLAYLLKEERNIELNAALFDGIEGIEHTDKVADFRVQLWTEHLGIKPQLHSQVLRYLPEGGWLALWKKIAEDNIVSLNSELPTMEGNILPYDVKDSGGSEDILESLGINMDREELKVF